MILQLSKRFLIGVIGLLTLIIILGIFYIVRSNVGARTSYSVKTFTPQGEVPQWADFSITFSEPVIDNVHIGSEVPQGAIQFTPAVDGRAQWITRDRVDFFLESALVPSTQYTVNLTPKLNPSSTFVLTGQRSFAFATQRFAVRETAIEFKYDDARQNAKAVGTITFNYPVNIPDLNAHLSVQRDDNTEISYQIVTRTAREVRTVKIETVEIPRQLDDELIKVKIEKDFKCTGGQLSLKRAHVTPIVLNGRGTLGVAYCRVTEIAGQPSLLLRFSTPVPEGTLEPFIHIEPAVEHRVAHDYDEVLIHGKFKRQTTYTLTIDTGLTARDGSVLKKPYTTRLTVPDISPDVRFHGNGFFLAKKRPLNLGIATINVKRLNIEIDKVFPNNIIYISKLSRWSGWDSTRLGKHLRTEVVDVDSKLNEEVTTSIPLNDALKDEHVGIFKIKATDVENRWVSESQWVLLTDLGIVVKRGGDTMYVWVKSLSTSEPVPMAQVKLISDNNQNLLNGTTNWSGYVKFTEVAARTEGFTPFMLTVTTADDLAFIEFDRHGIATTDFNVGGPTYLEKGYEAFLYTSCGVYRPGKTVHLAGIVRDKNQKAPPPLPASLEILAPDGRIIHEMRLQTSASGSIDVQFSLPAYAPTGGYRAKLSVADTVIGRAGFQVEEFMPERMKVSIAADKLSYSLGDAVNIEVAAVNLVGPPASEKRVQVSCELEAVPFTVQNRMNVGQSAVADDSVRRWPRFVFEDERRAFEQQRIELGEATTDASGKANYQWNLPDTLKAPSLIHGVIKATVREIGGRAVTSTRRVVIHPYSHYVGIRRVNTGSVKPEKPLDFEVVAVDATGSIVAGRTLVLTFHKVNWNTLLRQNARGEYAYLSEPETIEIGKYTLTTTAAVRTVQLMPPEYGEYRVSIEDSVSGARADMGLDVTGWGDVSVSMAHPSRLELTLDKATYRPGETATLNITAPFPGTLLLTVEREKVLSYRTLTLNGNSGTFTIPVLHRYTPNVYLSATLIRKVPEVTSGNVDAQNLRDTESNGKYPAAENQLRPARAFGVVPLKLDNTPNRLSIELDVPEETRPNRDVEIAFRVKGQRSWQQYDVCIAAVDEGILALTNFQTPNPHDYFYRQRGLKIRSYDMYSAILPEIVQPPAGTGGDARRAVARARRLNVASVKRVKPVTLWSGILKTDRRGNGTVRFRIPQFNGTLRLMAVASAGADYGAAEANLLVRDSIVLTPTFPRFLAGGDMAHVPVTLFNGTGKDGTFAIKLEVSDRAVALLEAPSELTIGSEAMEVSNAFVEKQVSAAAGAEAQVLFDILAHDAIGDVTFTLTASGNNEGTNFSVTLPLRSAAPPVTKTGHGLVRAGEPADFIFPANFIPDSSEFTLALSPFPVVQFSDSMRYLLQYPHGCAEQTTSRVFPLLYFSELANVVEPSLAELDGGRDTANNYIAAGITKLESLLMSNNYFAYWPGGTYHNPWSSIYAAHFLVEARKAGYDVASRIYDRMLDGLRQQARLSQSASRRNQNGTLTANVEHKRELVLASYACYVLAAAGVPETTVMHYLKNSSTLPDYSQFQLAAAFARSGKLEVALSMLPVSVSPNQIGPSETGGTLDSPVRAQAIMLDVLSEVNENHPSVPMLVKNLSEAVTASGNRWATTQENAFAFLALGKIMKKQVSRDYTGTFTLNDTHVADFDSTERRYTDTVWDGARVQLSVQGKGSCYYHWRAFGIQRDSFIEEYSRELQVHRRYFSQNGAELAQSFAHGDLIVAEISVKALTENLENVVVVDMVPAGFEIENPRLESRAGIPWIKTQDFKPDYLDIRDDRLIFFGVFPRQRERKFYYALRAVTQGEFILPPVAAEAMYDATKSAVAGSRRIKVVGIE